MSVRASNETCAKAAVSVSEMARRFHVSRSRFYDLIREGIVPQPVYCTRTRRPMYVGDMIERCLHVRRTNTAIDGSYVVFYDRREQPSDQRPVDARARLRRHATPSPEADGQMSELVESLRGLGVTATQPQIAAAVRTCYPSGITDLESAVAAVFRHLRRSHVA